MSSARVQITDIVNGHFVEFVLQKMSRSPIAAVLDFRYSHLPLESASNAFLKEKIKAENKLNHLKNRVSVSTDKKAVLVTVNIDFSKRCLKYLVKKFLKNGTKT